MILIHFIKYYIKLYARHLYWLYRLGQSNFGKNTILQFPIVRGGKGSLGILDNSFIGRDSQLSVGIEGELSIGNYAYISPKSIIIVSPEKNLIIGNNFKIGEDSKIYVGNDWIVGDNVKIETKCSISAREPQYCGKLFIGNSTHIGDSTIIDTVDDVFIGTEVAIGPNCTLYTHDHIYSDKNLPAWKGGIIKKPITIEDGVWIGSGVTILPGVVIGKRAVIAAGSIVTKNVPSNMIYGGIPAKLLKEI